MSDEPTCLLCLRVATAKQGRQTGVMMSGKLANFSAANRDAPDFVFLIGFSYFF